jgi:flagellar biosynthetic protein FlhB
MSEGSDDGDKTQDATPERRKQAREQGQFARAKDTGAVAATSALLLGLSAFGDSLVASLRDFSLHCFRDTLNLTGVGMDVAGREAALTLVRVIAPITGTAAVAAVAAGIWEAGFQPQFELALPKWERLDPLGKLGQLFSPKAAAGQVALALGRVAAVGFVAYLIVSRELPRLERLSTMRFTDAALTAVEVLSKLGLWCTLALAVLTALDYGYSWVRHENSIKMSLEEVKREHQQQEGDPRLKGRRLARARERLRRGLKKQVLESDVIIANPTHISIAVRYRPAQGAPQVLARGYDEVALYMRKLADENSIPIVENKPLARALAQVRVGKTIPIELYAAVAEVLAFVYRLKNRGRRA